MAEGQRDRERDSQREGDRERQRQRQRDRDTKTEMERQRHRDGDRETETERRRQRDRGTETDRDRGTEAEKRQQKLLCLVPPSLSPQLPHVSCLSPFTPLSPGPSSPPLLGRLSRTVPSHSHPSAVLLGAALGALLGEIKGTTIRLGNGQTPEPSFLSFPKSCPSASSTSLESASIPLISNPAQARQASGPRFCPLQWALTRYPGPGFTTNLMLPLATHPPPLGLAFKAVCSQDKLCSFRAPGLFSCSYPCPG